MPCLYLYTLTVSTISYTARRGTVKMRSILFFAAAAMLLSASARGSKLKAQDEAMHKLFPSAKAGRPSGTEDPELQLFDEALNVTGNPTVVRVSMHILDIAEIDDDEQELKVTLYLRHMWNDPRFIFTASDTAVEDFTLSEPNKLWTPDSFFVNERQGRAHDVTTKNSFVRVKTNGDILYSVRYTVKLACPMDHTRFPFDKQICSMSLESYGYTMEDLVLLWDEEEGEKKPFTVGKSINPKPFNLKGYGIGYCNGKVNNRDYSCLRAEFLLSRGGAGRAVLQVVLPLGVVMLLSYLTLVCNARRGIRMLVAVFLFLIVLLAAPFVVQLAPETRDATALDCWAAWCVALAALPVLIIGFAAMAEARHAAAQKARGYETCAEDGNKTLELLSPPFIDSEKEESNGADLSAAQAISAGVTTKQAPCKSRCVFARLGITGDKIERCLGIFAFVLVLVVVLVYSLVYGIDMRCYQSLGVEKKFEY
ncbi:hypothetical protein B566_EDAN005222 [Ephemera danica]|nr:hypothetical protein B566_EDAN005222 [Ephemera danica]